MVLPVYSPAISANVKPGRGEHGVYKCILGGLPFLPMEKKPLGAEVYSFAVKVLSLKHKAL